jgi:hypothetical protein
MTPVQEYHFEHADLRIEQDLVSVRTHGSLKEVHLPRLGGLLQQIREQHGKIFVLIDMRGGETIPPPMRRTIAQIMADSMPAATAVYGASVEQRGGHALLMGAVNGVSGHRPNVAYFQSEAEAREWLAAERQRLSGA